MLSARSSGEGQGFSGVCPCSLPPYLHRDMGVIPRQLDVQAIFPPLNGGHGVGKHLTAKDHILSGHIPNIVRLRQDLGLWGRGMEI